MRKKREYISKDHAKGLRVDLCKMNRPEFVAFTGYKLRTIEDYEDGRRKCPKAYEVKILSLHQRDAEITRSVIAEVEAAIDRKYPKGIVSA